MPSLLLLRWLLNIVIGNGIVGDLATRFRWRRARGRCWKAGVRSALALVCGFVGAVRYTLLVPDEVAQLLVTEAALGKLGGRSISAEEAEQLPRNSHLMVRNPNASDPDTRRLLIGKTDGGRTVTLVVEQTVEPTTWLIVTGWESTTVERKLLQS